jgi:peptide deformylase
MVKETIVQTDNPVLRKHAKPVLKKELRSKALGSLISRMKKVLAAEKHGVAIAAPQLGESLRMFIVAGRAFQKPDSDEQKSGSPTSRPKRDEGGPRTFAKQSPANDIVFINPELIRVSKKKSEMPEGCLSVRGMYGSVLRHTKATVKALDEKGKPFIYHGSGLVAQIFQHEIDHLGGILYTDKATSITKDTRI